VAIEVDLAPDRPHAIRLLGNPLVVWRDGGGAWRCFKDVCPHRSLFLEARHIGGLCSKAGGGPRGRGGGVPYGRYPFKDLCPKGGLTFHRRHTESCV